MILCGNFIVQFVYIIACKWTQVQNQIPSYYMIFLRIGQIGIWMIIIHSFFDILSGMSCRSGLDFDQISTWMGDFCHSVLEKNTQNVCNFIYYSKLHLKYNMFWKSAPLVRIGMVSLNTITSIQNIGYSIK